MRTRSRVFMISVVLLVLTGAFFAVRAVRVRKDGSEENTTAMKRLSGTPRLNLIYVSASGGALGILLGIGASRLVTRLAGWPVAVSPEAVALAFGFAAFIGIFFGFYPARKASRLDPIDALRYE